MFVRSASLEVPGMDISVMKQTLFAQQQLLEKLHNELAAEREASATAATETLSMIVRLQGQKAELAMEASQYKRMAEAKMGHAENSLTMFEDLIYQKEMEIAALEFQAQSYRCKLMSLGYADIGILENKFQTNEVVYGETSSSIKRLQSLPTLRLCNFDDKISLASESDSVHKQVISQESKKSPEISPASSEESDSYWEQIKKLDEQVKKISDVELDSKEPRSDKHAVTRSDATVLEKTKCHEYVKKFDTVANTASKVQDIFVVPETFEGEDRLGKPDSIAPNGEDVTESFKTELHNKNLERKLSKPPRDWTVKKCCSAREYQHGMLQLRDRLKRIEEESQRSSGHDEITREGREELILLKEVRDQVSSIQSEIKTWNIPKKSPPREDTGVHSLLSSIQSEIKSWKISKISPPRDDPGLRSLQEAMLYFWL